MKAETQKQLEAMTLLRDEMLKADNDVLKFGVGYIKFTNEKCEHVPFDRIIESSDLEEPDRNDPDEDLYNNGSAEDWR